MPTVNIEIDEDVFLPCYHHLLDETEFFDIDFLYGGRDSGKSRHIAMQLVIDCLRSSYFQCLLIRKELNTVRDSQFSLIKSVIEEWGIEHLFSINSTRMEIRCKANNNGFYGRGLDKVGKIKSFNNPSHCWIEEGNQIEKDDLVVILTSLRAKVRVKTWFSFNPECEMTYTDFWLWNEYFSHTTQLSWTWVKTIPTKKGPVDLRMRATHTTYLDNPYCASERAALYESYKGSRNNAYWYQTYTLGLWGYKRTGGEFFKCFEEARHVAKVPLRKTVIYLCCDNNVVPYLPVAAWQVSRDIKKLSQVKEFTCESPENTAPKAARKCARWLRSINYENVVYVGGDPSAKARSTVDEDGRSFFDVFIQTLKDEGFSVVNKVQKSAPEVARSGEFINEIYESNYMGWSIEISDECEKSKEDYTMAKEDAEGKILKKNETDKETKQSFQKYGHYSDIKRYFITSVLEAEFNKYKSRRKKGSTAA